MKLLFLLFFFPLQIFSQDITGVWTGTLYNDTTKEAIKYELAISEYDGKLSGYSHTIFVIDSIENVGVKSVKIKRSGDYFIIEDDKLIDNNYTAPPAKGVKTYSNLVLSQSDSTYILSGSFETNQTRVYKKITGNIYLQKRKPAEQNQIFPKLEKLGVSRTLSFATSYTKARASINSKQISPVSLHREAPEPVSETQKINTKVSVSNNESIVSNKPVTAKPAKIIPSENSHKEDFNKSIAQSETKSTIITANEKPKDNRTPTTEKLVAATKQTEVSSTSYVSAGPSEIKTSKIINDNKPLTAEHSRNLTLITPSAPVAAANLSSRKIETIKSVEIKQDSLVLSLFDNGEIDGDTVSVLLNGQVIMPRQGLTTRAINKTIYLTPDMGDSVTIIMYAENLGSIPPNTGLLVIHDGEDIFEIRFAGDLQKNSAIILKRKKKR